MSSVLNRDTLIPLGLVAGIVTVVAMGTTLVNGQLVTSELAVKFLELNHRIDDLEEGQARIEYAASTDRATKVPSAEFQLWVERLRAMNDNLNVPDFPIHQR